ncbi:tetratricopeptide repeat protein [Leptospira broomii serovar Hurstbridge str. 5399]|uniref:Tetratricopeptide repeat protein n=1 Tax=Leptospira broomii serovar Hurstbridge str. 5399 TaxID=1049789 RepID=T0F6Z8_9LEPT|nr:tetratricopeptide repeat protein [Leptospira broomii]EQA43297.1 tetratricopeptide repeat protein [Leptospira broomii serovar Hurstbridge str. 5399]
MAKSAALSTQVSLEESVWELFETGSYEEVVRVAERHPENVFINHLRAITEFETGGESANNFPLEGKTVLTPLLAGYLHRANGRVKEAALLFHEYFKASSSLVSYSILKTGIKTCEEAGGHKAALDLILRYKALFKDNYFAKLEFFSFYYLRKFEEALVAFKDNASILKEDRDVLAALGLCLVQLGKFEEAKGILEKLPGAGEIPSYEEKVTEYAPVIQSISVYEKRRKELSKKELLDLGYAYLFSESYKKAEEVFTFLVSQAK